MYWTAHHVGRGGVEDVHVFVYSHGAGFEWPEDPRLLRDENPGTLVLQRTPVIPAGGNRVMSYLDVFAPDGCEDDAQIAVLRFLARVDAERNPTTWQMTRATVVFGTELLLEPRRREELVRLATAIWPDFPRI